MNKQTQILNFLGLAQRAGKVITGDALVLNEVRQQQAKIVFVAHDASEGTKKKFSDKCGTYEVPLFLDFSTAELSQAIGKERRICTVVDNGFAKKLIELLQR